MLGVPDSLRDAVRRRHAAFPMRIETFRRRRWVRVVGPVLAPDPEREELTGIVVATPWGRWGSLYPRFDDLAAEQAAQTLLTRFAARDAAPPPAGRTDVLLGPSAAAVLLHEAVAHALECDRPLRRPDARAGSRLAASCLTVFDDPGRAPSRCAGGWDDEGVPVSGAACCVTGSSSRRWRTSPTLRTPKNVCRRRAALVASPPVCSALPPPGTGGASSEAELLAAAVGAFRRRGPRRRSIRTEVDSPRSPRARRVGAGGLEDAVGRFRLAGSVVEVLGAIESIGRDARPAAAGWCAKGGDRLPVWATAGALLLRDVEVIS
ncbi:MAG: metallopeptidase TldD-related protein [Thermoanaerobaculia bacterium]